MVNYKESKEESIENIKSMAVKYLGYGDRTVFEMKKYLLEKNIEKDTVDDVIEYLKEMKYLDDERYAIRYAEILENKGNGKFKAIIMMKNKGLEQKFIDIAFEEGFFSYEKQMKVAEKIKHQVYDNENYFEIENMQKEEIYEKRKKIKGKLARKLENKGFGNNIIFSIIED